MNTLIVGAHTQKILEHLPGTFLLIDDGPLIDQITTPPRRAVTRFDYKNHSFDPLKDMSFKKALDFIDILNAIFPEGGSTLTRRASNFALLQKLLSKKTKLENLISKKDNEDAYEKIQTLLLSPILNGVINNPTNLSFAGILLAKLDRAVLGNMVCYVLANFLISQYEGPVVIPDFGFYAHKGHSDLLRQGRLTIGIRSFAELPDFKVELLSIENKMPSRCVAEDAEILAQYKGLMPGVVNHSTFITEAIGG